MVKRKAAAASASEDGMAGEVGADTESSGLGGDEAAGPGDGGQVHSDAACADAPAGQAEPDLPEFPCHVVIRNNSGIALADPVSGAFAQAGGSATVQLHDADHASEVVRSLTAFAEANYIPFDKLAIEPA